MYAMCKAKHNGRGEFEELMTKSICKILTTNIFTHATHHAFFLLLFPG
jgi:hypothetical protein